mmetsp:Transcript_57430/g.138015  ORF Transcript_57430/g.138015 Transcript_57430/m.138015 type:complete len:332 (-) Transcript_57430:137-1132(-)
MSLVTRRAAQQLPSRSRRMSSRGSRVAWLWTRACLPKTGRRRMHRLARKFLCCLSPPRMAGPPKYLWRTPSSSRRSPTPSASPIRSLSRTTSNPNLRPSPSPSPARTHSRSRSSRSQHPRSLQTCRGVALPCWRVASTATFSLSPPAARTSGPIAWSWSCAVALLWCGRSKGGRWARRRAWTARCVCSCLTRGARCCRCSSASCTSTSSSRTCSPRPSSPPPRPSRQRSRRRPEAPCQAHWTRRSCSRCAPSTAWSSCCSSSTSSTAPRTSAPPRSAGSCSCASAASHRGSPCAPSCPSCTRRRSCAHRSSSATASACSASTSTSCSAPAR